MNIKRHPADKYFSLCIRERDDWTCRDCGREFEPGSAQLQCAHIWSRRHTATRWHPANALALCFSCHQKHGENPLGFVEWLQVQGLHIPHPDTAPPLKRSHETLKAVAAHYRAQYRAMQAGEAGPIPFGGYSTVTPEGGRGQAFRTDTGSDQS